MTIEQKAREIGTLVFNESSGIVARKADLNEAARLGIVEGLEMAAKWHDEQAEKEEFAPRLFHQKSAAAIRALIEEP